MNCKNCNNSISKIKIFCDNKCQQAFQYNKSLEEWLNGKNFIRKGGVSVPVWMRRYLLEEANYQCVECGWGKENPHTKTVPLDIDHIDGDAYNNLRENLQVLCPNCHSLKKTFKNTGRRKSTRNRIKMRV
jgi:5-methylcytosine-specific restriction endonuclease McrA